MKKFSILILALILCSTLLSCASNNTSSVSYINTQSQTESSLSSIDFTSSSGINDSSDNISTSQSTWINYSISNQSDEINQNAIDVSIIQLIASPEKYQNKVVRVIGVGNIDFEGDSVYLSKDDWKYDIYENSFWLDVGEDFQYEEAGKINGKYVIIVGTFNMNNKGHLGLWSGSIEKITRYQLWEDRYNSTQ